MAAGGIQWTDIAPYVGNAGFAAVWVYCWLKGIIVSEREMKRADEERSEWKDLYITERDAHEKTREALRLASERGESTTEALQLVAGVMTAVRAQAEHEILPEASSARGSGPNKQGARSSRQIRPPG